MHHVHTRAAADRGGHRSGPPYTHPLSAPPYSPYTRKGWKGIHIELHICRSRNGRISRRRFRTLLVLKEGVDSGKGEEYSISYSSNSSSSSSSSSSNSSKRARQQGKEYLSCKSHTLRRSSKLGSCDEPPLNDGRARVRLVREERSNHGDTR